MDPDKIKGNIQRPYPPPKEKETPDKIDPEKFKKIMKIDESEEAQKRKKRQLPKEEEDADDEIVQAKTPPPPSTSFSEYMSDKDRLNTVFDKESGGIRRQTLSEEQTPPPFGSISTKGIELDQNNQPSPPSPGLSSQPPSEAQQKDTTQQPRSPSQPQQSSSSVNKKTLHETPPVQEPNAPPPSLKEPSEKQPQPSPRTPQASAQNNQEKIKEQPSSQSLERPNDKERNKIITATKKKKKDTSLLASQPKTKNLEALKKKKDKKITPKVKTVSGKKSPQKSATGIPPTKKKATDEMTETGKPFSKSMLREKKILKEEKTEKEQTVSKMTEKTEKETTKKAFFFKRFTPEQIRNQKKLTTETTEFPIPPFNQDRLDNQEGKHQGKEKEDFIEADSATAGIPLPTFETPLPAIIPATDIPVYSKLSPELHELFEKIGGVLTIQQDKGITTTTMNINLPNSIFDGTQVILDQYSTAPNSYNIQFIGNPESVKIFNQNLDSLKKSFNQANFNFETNILNPILSIRKKSSHIIRRKGKANEKGDKQEK